MKKWIAVLMLFALPAWGANFYWKQDLTSLNAIAGKADGDRGIVLDNNGVLTHYYHTGGAWVAVTAKVAGPASSTDSYFAYFDGTTGKLLKDGQSSVNPAFSTINVYGANALNLGTSSSLAGSIRFKNATNGNYFPIVSGVSSDNTGWTLPTTGNSGGANYLLNVDADGTMGYTDPAGLAGSGDVVGPASATDNALAVYDGTTGKLLKNSPITIGADNSIVIAQSATVAGYWRGYELSGNGTNYVSLRSPDALAGNVTWILPSADSDGILQSNGSGTFSLSKTVADPVFSGSSQLPNGANPTVDAAGEIAVDTSATVGAGLRVYAHATYGAVSLPLVQTKCSSIDNTVATSDYPLERFPYAVTIKAVHLYQTGATNVVGQLDECTAAATCTAVDSADITGTADTNVDDDGTLSNPGIAAGARIWWRTTSVSGTNTQAHVCFDYTVDAVN